MITFNFNMNHRSNFSFPDFLKFFHITSSETIDRISLKEQIYLKNKFPITIYNKDYIICEITCDFPLFSLLHKKIFL